MYPSQLSVYAKSFLSLISTENVFNGSGHYVVNTQALPLAEGGPSKKINLGAPSLSFNVSPKHDSALHLSNMERLPLLNPDFYILQISYVLFLNCKDTIIHYF